MFYADFKPELCCLHSFSDLGGILIVLGVLYPLGNGFAALCGLRLPFVPNVVLDVLQQIPLSAVCVCISKRSLAANGPRRLDPTCQVSCTQQYMIS